MMAAFFHFPYSGYPSNFWSSSSSRNDKTTPSHLVVVSSSLRLGSILHPRVEQLRPLLCSYFQEVYQSHYLPNRKEFVCGRPLKRFSNLETLVESFLAIQSPWLCLIGGKESEKGLGNKRKLHYKDSSRNRFDGRLWTNILLAVNVLAYVAQVATQGRLILWGAKVNSLISEGQIWRLATSSFLHANVIHLMVNCYSLNSVGPTVETFSGPKRFLAIYLTSAVASSFMSYRFCQSPSVGASGAIFGMVGSIALYVLRHSRLIGAGKKDLLQIVQVIGLNMLVGLSIRGIDNWGHVGGFLGGIAISWLLGPSWRSEFRTEDGKQILTDKAPILKLINWRRTE